MYRIADLIRAEPIRFVAAIQATVALVVLFGVAISAPQVAGIVLAVSAWLSLVTRSKVQVVPDA
jgi:hypothetical protein